MPIMLIAELRKRELSIKQDLNRIREKTGICKAVEFEPQPFTNLFCSIVE